MGTYVYTARATGRVPVWINGGIEWVFPLKFSFKPMLCGCRKRHERWERAADRQVARIEAREDWSGYVELNGNVYHSGSPYYNDCSGPHPPNFVGTLVKFGKEWIVL